MPKFPNTIIRVSAGVKAKLSLCLTKYHTIKTYPLLNYASHHKDVLGSGGMAPRILNLSTKWRWVVSFTPRPLYCRGKSPRHPLDRRLDGPQSLIWTWRWEENTPARSLVTTLTELQRFILSKHAYFTGFWCARLTGSSVQSCLYTAR
jgi:hypothetical protein